MHRAPKYWKSPDEFLPERWLVEPGHELYQMKGAWSSLEHGPYRTGFGDYWTEGCLASIVREFGFKPAYDEWDALHPRSGVQKYRGERVYQIEEGSAPPRRPLPV